MRRGSADSIRASGQDPASTGRIQSCNLPAPSHEHWSLPSGRRPYKFHEDAEGRGVYPMAFESAEDVACHLPRFIDSYNERRLHSALRS